MGRAPFQNFFDNAETYARGESEKVMGEAIKMGIQNGDWIREDLVWVGDFCVVAPCCSQRVPGVYTRHALMHNTLWRRGCWS